MQSIFVVIIRHQITTFLFCIFCAYITLFNAAEYIFILKTKRATLYKLNPFHVNTAYCLIYYKVLPSVRVPAVSQSVCGSSSLPVSPAHPCFYLKQAVNVCSDSDDNSEEELSAISVICRWRRKPLRCVSIAGRAVFFSLRTCESAARGQRAGSVPCFTATGRDGVLMPVNKQKKRAEGGERRDAASGRWEAASFRASHGGRWLSLVMMTER